MKCQVNIDVCIQFSNKVVSSILYLVTLSHTNYCIWAASSENEMSLNMRNLHGFRSPCACINYHPNLCSPLTHYVMSKDSVSLQWKPWLDCADEQTDLGLHCSYMPEDTFSHCEAYMKTLHITRCVLYTFQWLSEIASSAEYPPFSPFHSAMSFLD